MWWPFKNTSMVEIENLAVKRAIARVVDGRTYYGFTGHPHVKKFEQQLSRQIFSGVPVLGANSGSDALILALKALKIGHGDEVIVPAFSFISTASTVGWVGAAPVFVDITSEDYAINPERLEEKITPRTKAIIIAHLFGQPALGIQQICEIAKRHNIAVIEDAAQSLGAKIKIDDTWRMVGAIGDIGCLSFSSTKPFAAPGNGGALVLRDKDLYEVVYKMRSYGSDRPYFECPVIGVNAKLHEVQAAALLAKFQFFNYWMAYRKKLAMLYQGALEGVGDLELPREHPSTERTWYRYIIRSKRRNELFEYLKRELGTKYGLWPTLNYSVLLPYFSAFKNLGHRAGDFPAGDRVSQEVLCLPITNYVQEGAALLIGDLIRKFFSK